MGCADLLGGEEVVLDSEAVALKVGPNLVEAELEVASDVLEEANPRVTIEEHPQDVRPQVARISGAEALAGLREGLAGVARNDAIHDSTPRASVEGSDVRPDRSPIQGRLFHPAHEDGRGEGFPLNVANALQPPTEPEVEPADSGAEGEGT